MSDRKCLRFFYDAFENGIEPHADHLGKNEGIFMVEGLNSLKEIFPVQSCIFSTRAISRWKKKWIGLGR